ncbi:unnamed protein product [Medioppia subpectinata]|uniref:C2H2-type domain-containing protein n=1 Tax=Medioppia subpectinata TaxID=1979941 RepID=A0A7R9Q0Y8_9ACAR|nr:unnamed protein product [Medioppia subpectinata]CAG2108500.1 unnamed protein product [Medioppia subpectinata]
MSKKSFKCDEQNCGKSFDKNFRLNEQKRIHSGEKPFVCHFNYCNKSFLYKCNLMRHMNRAHKCVDN